MAAVEVKLEGVELGVEGAVVVPAAGRPAAERQLRSGDSMAIDTGKDSTTFALGVRWDEIKGRNPVDLDAACIALDEKGNYLTTCYFGELKCFSGALVHSGDSRDGKGEGDDEVITINLVDLPPNVAVFYFVINSYHGDTFMEVETAEASLTCLESKRMLLNFNLTCQNAEATALLFARLFRDPSNHSKWTFTAVGSGVRAPSFSALIPQVQERCRDIIPAIVPAKVGDVVFLVKGESVSLGAVSGGATIGLGWDFLGESIDLDASLVCYGPSMEELARVSFSNKVAFDGLIKHSGDNVTGQGDGDDEQIAVKLSELPPSVTAIAICVTSFRGHTFAKIKGAYCRIFDSTRELCRYPLSNCSPGTAYIMAILSRRPRAGAVEWSLKAHGVAGMGQTVNNCVAPMRTLVKQDFGMPLTAQDTSDLTAFRAGVPASAPPAVYPSSASPAPASTVPGAASAPAPAPAGCCVIL